MWTNYEQNNIGHKKYKQHRHTACFHKTFQSRQISFWILALLAGYLIDETNSFLFTTATTTTSRSTAGNNGQNSNNKLLKNKAFPIMIHHSIPSDLLADSSELNGSVAWQSSLKLSGTEYVSPLFSSFGEWKDFIKKLESTNTTNDSLWAQVSFEATSALVTDPEAGPQLYQGILSQPSLLDAIVTVISHEIATELIPATAVKNLFFEMLTQEDNQMIRSDLIAASQRCASVKNAMAAVLFQKGFHALVCYRVGHRLWENNRKGLAYYIQSTVSRTYSADIHPAATMGYGIHLRTSAGVVIGETAVVGNDVTILQGVTLGGTGKEAGDRHPKVSSGVTILDDAAILGNIRIEEGSIINSKSIVTKPVPPLATVSGIPARVQSYREVDPKNLPFHLLKYSERWKKIESERIELEEKEGKQQKQQKQKKQKQKEAKQKRSGQHMQDGFYSI